LLALKAYFTEDPAIRLRIFGRLEAVSFSGDDLLPRGRKAQSILCYLALSTDEAVPRQRFLDLLWSSRGIEQARASLRQSVLELRSAFRPPFDGLLTIERDFVRLDRSRIWIDGVSRRADADRDLSHAPHQSPETILETLIGLDPKFDLWIREVREGVAAHQDREPSSNASNTPLPRRPDLQLDSDLALQGLCLTVAPLLKVGSDELGDYVPQALTQEIITALSRFRWIRVRFSPSPEPNAHYRLEGYVSRVGEECRLVLRLLDQADRGLIAWTGAALLPIPLQYPAIAQIVERIVAELDPEILAIETRKALYRPSTSAGSYECVLRSIPLIYNFDVESWQRATALLGRAIEIDSQHGRAYAFSALCRATGLAQGWSDDPARDLAQLDQDVQRAIACDPRDSLALALSGHIHAFLHHDFDAARALFDRAIHANPSCGFTWGYSSLTYAYLGQTDEAMRRLVRAQTIMIHDPFSSFVDAFYCVITYFARDWTEAVDACRRQLRRRPAFTNIRKLLIGALCFQGEKDEARVENERLLGDESDFTWERHLATYPFGLDKDREDLRKALEGAGLVPPVPPSRCGPRLRNAGAFPHRHAVTTLERVKRREIRS
jgi:DNA-binding winged helix-turn-helix (wHTH) protein/tetratricopeptide (TPR) repeat protein